VGLARRAVGIGAGAVGVGVVCPHAARMMAAATEAKKEREDIGSLPVYP
jgi:hypothetical protein